MMIAFYGLLLVVVIVWIWHVRNRGRQVKITFALFGLSGVLIVGGSLALLPWIQLAGPDASNARLHELASNQIVQRVVDTVPGLCDLMGVRCPLQDATGRPFSRAELEETWQFAQTKARISAWSLWADIPSAGTGLRLALVLAAIAATVALLWSAAIAFYGRGLAWTIGAAICVVVGLPAFALLLGHVPSMDTFGMADDLGTVWLGLLLGSRTGPGLWWALLGLLVLVVSAGSAFIPVRDSSTPEVVDGYYDA